MKQQQRIIRARRIAIGLLALAVLGTACSDADSSTESSSTTSSTAPASGSGTAKIDAFDAPASVACSGKTSVTVQATYTVTGAERQELVVDGRAVPGTEASTATIDVPIHCDPLPHTFVLIAYDANGGKTVEQRYVETVLG